MEKIQIRDSPFDPREARQILDTEGCGAVVYFDGVMKGVLPDGTRVERLEWDAYEPMAVETLRSLRDEAIRRFALKDLVLIHRTDVQYPGDLIMTLGVSAERRKGAIESIAWFLDELKKIVPLWKKEILGGEGSRWIEGEENKE